MIPLLLITSSFFCMPLSAMASAFVLFLITPPEEHRFSSDNIATTLLSSLGVAVVSVFFWVTWIGFMQMFGRLNARNLFAILGLSFLPVMGATVTIAATLFYRITLARGLRFSLLFFTTLSLLLHLRPNHEPQRVYFRPIQPLAIEENLST